MLTGAEDTCDNIDYAIDIDRVEEVFSKKFGYEVVLPAWKKQFP